jgi:hypothetical protein
MEAVQSETKTLPETVQVNVLFDENLQKLTTQFFHFYSQKASCSCLPNNIPRQFFPLKGKEVSISLMKGKKISEPIFTFIASENYTVSLSGTLTNIVCTITKP